VKDNVNIKFAQQKTLTVSTIKEIKKVFLRPNKYSLGKVDIDIFWRLCRVCCFMLS